jgi:hypothetical protein
MRLTVGLTRILPCTRNPDRETEVNIARRPNFEQPMFDRTLLQLNDRRRLAIRRKESNSRCCEKIKRRYIFGSGCQEFGRNYVRTARRTGPVRGVYAA